MRAGGRLRAHDFDFDRERRGRDFQLPAGIWHPFKFWVCIAVVLVMVGMNLRGVKESVLSLLPIFIAFIVMHLWLVGYALLSRRGSFRPSRTTQ